MLPHMTYHNLDPFAAMGGEYGRYPCYPAQMFYLTDPSTTVTAQVNGGGAAPRYQAHCRSKTSRVDQPPVVEAHGSGASDKWSLSLGVPDQLQHNHLPLPRNLHRAPVPPIEPYYEPGHTSMQDHPSSRIPAPDYGSERQYLPRPAALMSEVRLPLLDMAGPLPNSGSRCERERDRERE